MTLAYLTSSVTARVIQVLERAPPLSLPHSPDAMMTTDASPLLYNFAFAFRVPHFPPADADADDTSFKLTTSGQAPVGRRCRQPLVLTVP